MIRKVVAEHFVGLGWNDSTLAPAVANRFFRTAVGPKEAVVYLTKTSEGFLLNGYYYSEGRNVLDAARVLVAGEASKEEIQGAVSRYVADAESAINQSYAVRLLALSS